MKKMAFLCAVALGLMFWGAENAFGLVEETLGNKPLLEANYDEWKGTDIMPLLNHSSRVYHTWVNGNEHFYYRGDTEALNDMLRKYAAIEVKIREVVFRPGAAETETLQGESIPCDWELHLLTGLAAHGKPPGSEIELGKKNPTITVFIGSGNVEVEKIKIPRGIKFIDISDLRLRYSEGLKSSDSRVREIAANKMAKLKSYEKSVEDSVWAALHNLKYSDPREFVKLIWYEGMSYKSARRLIKSDSLPTLYELLKDPEYASYWAKVTKLIGWLSDKGNHESIAALYDYFRRGDDWTIVTDPTAGHSRVLGKIRSLGSIGRIGGTEADSILKKALTAEGAQELAGEWIDGPLPLKSKFDKTYVIEHIQGAAAVGIVYSQNEENIRLVEELYEKEVAEYKENKVITELGNHLVGALAYRDLIREKGMEAYLNLSGSGEFGDLVPYLDRYSYHIISYPATALPGNEKSIEDAVKDQSFAFAAVCEAIQYATGPTAFKEGFQHPTQLYKVVNVIASRISTPQTIQLDYINKVRLERAIDKGERVIWIVHKGNKEDPWQGVKALPDTPENRKVVIEAVKSKETSDDELEESEDSSGPGE